MKTLKIAIALILVIGFSNMAIGQDLVDWGVSSAIVTQKPQTIQKVEEQTRPCQTEEADILESQQQAYIQEQKAKREEEAKKETPE